MKALVIAVGVLVLVAVAGVIVHNASAGITPQVTPVPPANAGLASARSNQQLANTLFELVPGQVLPQSDSHIPPGKRFDVRVTVRNLDATRSLGNAFWEVTGQGFDARGREITPTTIELPPWGGFAGDSGGALKPGASKTGTVIVVAEGLASFEITFTYDEPGRTPASASFVYPYGS